MHIVDLSVHRPIMVLMGIIALAFFGVAAYFTIPISLFPDVSVPYIAIQTIYPGASPDVIETQITKKIEDQISSVGELESLTSYSMDNLSLVAAEFTYGKDENLAVQEVKDKIEVILADLPDDAERPMVSKVDMSDVMPVMSLVMEGDMEATELHSYANTVVKDKLSQVSGVGSISVTGGREREIRVEMDRMTVFSNVVSPMQVYGILRAANIELPGGNMQYMERDLPVRMSGEFTDLDEIRNLDVATGTGVFKLHQIADVRDATKDVRERTILLDKTAGTHEDNTILITVVKNPTSNTVEVVDGIMEKIEEIESESYGAVSLKVVKEDRTYVRDSVNDTLSNILLGVLFTGLILLFFLHDARSTLIVVLAMPFSIFSTFLVMKAMGIGFNMISLMGLSSSIGSLVANSVVVLENIFRHKELGHDRIESATRGTKEVLVAVLASTLTNVAVFVPLGSIAGLMGKVLGNFAFTIVIATIFSFLVSFTLTPMMASRILPAKVKVDGPVGIRLEKMFSKWEDGFARLLGWLLKTKRRAGTLVAVILISFIAVLFSARFMNFELFPQTDGGKIRVSVELPQGNDLEATAVLTKEIENRLAARDETESLLTQLGSSSSLDQDVSVAQMDVFLVPISQRKASNVVIAAEFTSLLSDIPGASIKVTPINEIDVAGQSSAISFNLQGRDLAELQGHAEKLKDLMNGVPGVTNATLSSKSGKTELVFRPKRKQIAEDGLTVQQVALTLRTAVDGMVAGTYKEGSEEFDIRVMIKDSSLGDIQDIRNVPVVSAAGVYPLSRYADLSFGESSNRIMRIDKSRTIEMTADILPGYAGGNVLNEVAAVFETYPLPEGYEINQGAMTEMLTDSIRSLVIAFFVAIILIYMLLAATLESLTQPLFIISTIPVSLIGVILACLITGAVLNVIAMLGIIMLVGIVVNNAILILDYYNQERARGTGVRDALVTACRLKLKPIAMSNLAIVLGMLPMALGIGASGAEMRQPMGIVIIGGILSAMLLTLVLLPSLEFLVSHDSSKESKEPAIPEVSKE